MYCYSTLEHIDIGSIDWTHSSRHFASVICYWLLTGKHVPSVINLIIMQCPTQMCICLLILVITDIAKARHWGKWQQPMLFSNTSNFYYRVSSKLSLIFTGVHKLHVIDCYTDLLLLQNKNTEEYHFVIWNEKKELKETRKWQDKSLLWWRKWYIFAGSNKLVSIL